MFAHYILYVICHYWYAHMRSCLSILFSGMSFWLSFHSLIFFFLCYICPCTFLFVLFGCLSLVVARAHSSFFPEYHVYYIFLLVLWCILLVSFLFPCLLVLLSFDALKITIFYSLDLAFMYVIPFLSLFGAVFLSVLPLQLSFHLPIFLTLSEYVS